MKNIHLSCLELPILVCSLTVPRGVQIQRWTSSKSSMRFHLYLSSSLMAVSLAIWRRFFHGMSILALLEAVSLRMDSNFFCIEGLRGVLAGTLRDHSEDAVEWKGMLGATGARCCSHTMFQLDISAEGNTLNEYSATWATIVALGVD